MDEVLAGTVSLALKNVLQVSASRDALSMLQGERSLRLFIRMTRFQLERNMVEAIAVLKGLSSGFGLFAMSGLAAWRGALWGLWSQKWSQLFCSQNVTLAFAMTVFQASSILQLIPWRGLSSFRRFAVDPCRFVEALSHRRSRNARRYWK